MKMTVELTDLTPSEIEVAIANNEENALCHLLNQKFVEAKEQNIVVKDFYYQPYVACSSEAFDMFSYNGLEALFRMHGYEMSYEESENCTEEDDSFGDVTVRKGDFAFKMFALTTMHDSLYALFADTKTALVVE